MLFGKQLIRAFGHYILFMAAIGATLLSLYLAKKIMILRAIAIFYFSGTLVIPLLLGSLGIYQFTARHNRRSGIAKIFLSFLCLGMFVYITLIEPINIQIERRTFFHPYVTETITLIHISDIQSNDVGCYEKKIFEILKSIPGDIILHTGDLVQPFYFTGYDVSRYEPELVKLAKLFRELQPRYGIYNVVGDTEIISKVSLFDNLSGVKTLQDMSVKVTTPGGVLNILGLKVKHSRYVENKIISSWLNQADANQVKILIGHAPDYIAMVADLGIDLCLAGHTHGGQIFLPGLGPLFASTTLPKRWARGFHCIGSTYFNVSAGIGVSHAWGLPPMRFLCPPAITIIDIQPQPKKKVCKNL